MSDQYGSDFITIADESGEEYELEVLSTLEYNGNTYLAVLPCSENFQPEVILFKSTEEDGENIISIIEDQAELEAVHEQMMDLIFQQEE